jgi:serpin B
MSRISVIALAALSVGAIACHSPDPRIVDARTAALDPIVTGNNEFAWDMLRTVEDLDSGNLFFSPFSMVACLSMVYGGAEGDTETQLAEAMSVPVGGEAAWHDNLGALLTDLSGEHYRGYTLYAANRVWGREGYPFVTSYRSLLEDSYLAPIEETDFAADPEASRAEINDWVAEVTQDRIPELFEPGDINGDTVLALVNAIYFMADWSIEFDPDLTRDRSFELADGGTVTVPMMEGEDSYLAGRQPDGTEILQLPYADEELSMVILLPPTAAEISDLVTSLDDATVTDHLAMVAEREEFTVVMPSFQMDYDLPFDQALQALGIVDAFDPILADFSGIVAPEDGQIWIGAARHKAFVRVDEFGTEAAAATGITMEDGSAGPDEFTSITVDRPFVYMIRDDLTDTVLFTGLMMDPSQAPLLEE